MGLQLEEAQQSGFPRDPCVDQAGRTCETAVVQIAHVAQASTLIQRNSRDERPRLFAGLDRSESKRGLGTFSV